MAIQLPVASIAANYQGERLVRREQSQHDVLPSRAGEFTIDPAVRFLRGLHRHVPIDVASIHVDHDTDFEDRVRYRRRVEPFIAGLTTHCLRKGLPDVSWAMLFGPPYIQLFGLQHLLRTPAAVVEEMAGGVYVQLTEDTNDVGVHRESYLAAQRAAREHLGADAFLGDASAGQIRVPEFLYPVQ